MGILDVYKVLQDYKINPEEYMKLSNIGGCKRYHQEGNALKHSLLVWEASQAIFPDSWHMQRVALLHDIGKIYTSIEKSPGEWEYPDHSICGSLRGILCKFINQNEECFTAYQWLIRNHIKPLFWQYKGVNCDSPYGLDLDLCNLNNLRLLAICDLMGSEAENKEEQEELIHYLKMLEL